MAINYLNSIDLNRNELQDAQLIRSQVENQPNDAAVGGTPVEGQLYFNTSDDVLKVYANGSWVEVGGGVISLTAGTYLTNSGTATDPIINHDLTTRTDGSTAETLPYGGTFTAYTDVTTNATGHVTDIEETVFTMPALVTYGLEIGQDGNNGATIELIPSSGTTQVVTIDGVENQTKITEDLGFDGTIYVGLADDVVIADTLEVGDDLTVIGDAQFSGSAFDIASGAIIDMGNNRVTQVADPTGAQDAATKQYVDDSVAGGLVYQGGYNAATNTPDLDSSPSSSIKTGWTYTVTADGLFFTEQVRVGDVLIAEIDTPTTLADWTTVQNNIDLADLATVGIGNVAPGDAIDVSYASGTATVSVENSTSTNPGALTVAASSGTFYDGLIISSYANAIATIGLNIDGLANVDTTSSSSKVAVYDEATDRNKSMELDNFFKLASSSISKTGTIAAGSLSGTVTHDFGQNTLVQTFDTGTGATVFCDVVRGTTSPYTVTATISATQATAITILVQKIG